MAKEIQLTNGGVTLVDDEDYESLSVHRWHHGSNGYARRGERVNGRVIAILMHRVIASPASNQKVDHWDGDGLNNRRENLRPCTHSQNLANQSGHVRQRSTPFKGVKVRKPNPDGSVRTKQFEARISENGITRTIGRFENVEDAARAYDAAALQRFGPFAKMNFTEGVD